ncbi:hypothetical protein TCSYLVIO_007897 [Trypanosoma cruzi]|nr:hypothetical protein TCSYLVIO_007897 [Trypanosoma cruzi]
MEEGEAKKERHTRLHRMHTRREWSVVPALLTEGTHTQEEVQRTQQHKSKLTIKRERSPHTTRIVGPREVQPIFIRKQFSCHRSSFIFSAHHFMQACEPSQQQPHAQKYKRKEWHNASNHLFVFLFGYYEISACLVLFFQRATLHACVVCWGFLQGAQLFIVLL